MTTFAVSAFHVTNYILVNQKAITKLSQTEHFVVKSRIYDPSYLKIKIYFTFFHKTCKTSHVEKALRFTDMNIH